MAAGPVKPAAARRRRLLSDDGLILDRPLSTPSSPQGALRGSPDLLREHVLEGAAAALRSLRKADGDGAGEGPAELLTQLLAYFTYALKVGGGGRGAL